MKLSRYGTERARLLLPLLTRVLCSVLSFWVSSSSRGLFYHVCTDDYFLSDTRGALSKPQSLCIKRSFILVALFYKRWASRFPSLSFQLFLVEGLYQCIYRLNLLAEKLGEFWDAPSLFPIIQELPLVLFWKSKSWKISCIRNLSYCLR